MNEAISAAAKRAIGTGAPAAICLATCLVISLAACGGGSDGGGSSSAATTVTPSATYTVGGGITGLTSQGLALANGTDAVSPIPGDSSFTFSKASPAGASYDVVVQLQPDGQTCTVTGGSGTIGNANVSNVQVACAAALYSIGGTLSGLTGAGLVLANGSDTVSPAAGATAFTFPTQVPTATSYAVAVQTQPTGATCHVTNGTGVVLTSSVANVIVTCM